MGLGDELFTVVAWTVLASVVLHGLSAKPVARKYGRWFAGMDPIDDPMPESEPTNHQQRIRRNHGSISQSMDTSAAEPMDRHD